MQKNSKENLKDKSYWGLNYKVGLYLITVITLMFAAITLFYLLNSVSRMKQDYQEQMSRIATTFATANVEALLTHDYPLIETSASAIRLSFPDILWVRFLGPAQNTLVQSGDLTETTETVTFKKNIVFQKKALGLLEIGFSMEKKKKAILKMTATIAGFGLLTLLLVSFFLFILLKKIVLTPIQQLHRFAKKIESGTLDATIHLASKNELGELANALNVMATSLRISLKKEKEAFTAIAEAEADRAKAQELKQLNIALQQEISKHQHAEATLKQHAEDLERFNRVAIDREQRMIELKTEINALSKQLGKKPPYDLSFMGH